MFTNRIDTAGNTIYEEVNSIFCPYCSNYFSYIKLNRNESTIIICGSCGREL